MVSSRRPFACACVPCTPASLRPRASQKPLGGLPKVWHVFEVPASAQSESVLHGVQLEFPVTT